VIGRFGIRDRNLEGQAVIDFAKRMEMAVVNTYFQKKEEHKVTYKSGGRSTQIDYIIRRRGNLSQTTSRGSVQNDNGGEKKEESEDRAEDQVVETVKEKCCEDFRRK